ncbi:MAG: hypothetical protein ABJO01_06390 [Parasphingorhabdus sp.]|uniref:alpha/beta hydrolase family protein n=1 Tax=Parasphingorhabdus sp. TaxID=2709688 RepID=UPI003299CC5C
MSVQGLEQVLETPSGHRFQTVVFAPDQKGQFPLILFSTGNFSSPDRYREMLRPLAAAGYIVVAPIHLDAEILALRPKPKAARVWRTRNEEVAFLATEPEVLRARLRGLGLEIDSSKKALMGHSYGALIAQLGAGAIARDPDGQQPNRLIADADILVAWSPPGPIAKTIDKKGWSTISVPSLTITGTADILPGFIDNWELHKASYAATPMGARWLWVGDDVDHYFGGKFGRIKPVSSVIDKRFDHALQTTISFLNFHLKPHLPHSHPLAQSGVSISKDK